MFLEASKCQIDTVWLATFVGGPCFVGSLCKKVLVGSGHCVPRMAKKQVDFMNQTSESLEKITSPLGVQGKYRKILKANPCHVSSCFIMFQFPHVSSLSWQLRIAASLCMFLPRQRSWLSIYFPMHMIYLVVLFSGMQPWRSAVLEWDQDPYRCKQTRLSCAKEAGWR